MKLTQEIFATGTWNGFPFTVNDLRKMASSFAALGDVLKVPLKLGHNDEQTITDGQPALGWVTAMEVIGEKLVATFEDIPEIVMTAFEKKLYRSVSIELDFDVTHKSTKYDFVVTAVALLGADMPAVNVLNDLAAFMSRNSKLAEGGYTADKRLSFSTITGNNRSSTMTPEEEAKLRQEVLTAKAAVETAGVNFAALKKEGETKAAQYAKDEEQRKADQKKITVDTARNVFTTMLEDAVKAEAITPAQRESYSKVLRIEDDDSVLALDAKDVLALLGADKETGKFTKRTARKEDENKSGDRVDFSLTQMTYEHMEKSGEKDFSRSLEIVMQANPEKAAEYIGSNGEVKQ